MKVATGSVNSKNGTGNFLITANGNQVDAKREAPGHWTGTNKTNGTTYDFSNEPYNSTFKGTKTSADGTETSIGQFTVLAQSTTDNPEEHQVTVLQVDRFDDGWKVPQTARK